MGLKLKNDAGVDSHHGYSESELFSMRRILSSVTDDEIRTSLIDLLNRVYKIATKDDVVILAARRLSCLYNSLVNSGVPPMAGLVMSDRALEVIPAGMLAGKRVIIMDDSLVVGSTLAFLVRDLKTRVGEDGQIQTHVACIDREQVSASLLEYISPQSGIYVSSIRLRKFSIDIAKVLFRSTMPYFSDFIISGEIDIELGELATILSAPTWHSADVTSSAIAGDDDASYSFIPTPETSAKLAVALSRVSPSAFKNVSLLKVRSFVKFDGTTTKARFVPIAVVDEANEKEIDVILYEFCTSLAIELPETLAAGSIAARHRLVQLLASLVSYETFLADHRNAIRALTITGDGIDNKILDVNSGHETQRFVVRAAEAYLKIFAQPYSLEADAPRNITAAPKSDLSLSDPRVTNRIGKAHSFTKSFTPAERPLAGQMILLGQAEVAPVADIFWYIDTHLESVERQAIRKMTVGQFFGKFPESIARRLNQGLTLRALSEVYDWKYADSSWCLEITSLAIDVCNDTGVAVPVTQAPNGADDRSARRYRVGENSSVGRAFGTPSRVGDRLIVDGYLMSRIRTRVSLPRDAYVNDYTAEVQERSRYNELALMAFGAIGT